VTTSEYPLLYFFLFFFAVLSMMTLFIGRRGWGLGCSLGWRLWFARKIQFQVSKLTPGLKEID
jgi:hypothetical protein